MQYQLLTGQGIRVKRCGLINPTRISQCRVTTREIHLSCSYNMPCIYLSWAALTPLLVLVAKQTLTLFCSWDSLANAQTSCLVITWALKLYYTYSGQNCELGMHTHQKVGITTHFVNSVACSSHFDQRL